ncbi:hypothetical protein HN011_009093 [Eciton burchellii]|nr:hypothetical protein HN011_009093 [Eciton burchellii]
MLSPSFISIADLLSVHALVIKRSLTGQRSQDLPLPDSLRSSITGDYAGTFGASTETIAIWAPRQEENDNARWGFATIEGKTEKTSAFVRYARSRLIFADGPTMVQRFLRDPKRMTRSGGPENRKSESRPENLTECTRRARGKPTWTRGGKRTRGSRSLHVLGARPSRLCSRFWLYRFRTALHNRHEPSQNILEDPARSPESIGSPDFVRRFLSHFASHLATFYADSNLRIISGR